MSYNMNVPESLFIERKTLSQGFSCEFFKFLRTSFLRNTSGWLLLFYNSYWLYLYFAIIYSWQLSSSAKSLVGKNVHPHIWTILQISFTQIFVLHFLWQMSVYLVSYGNCMLYSKQPTVLLARRYLKTKLLILLTKILKIKFHLEHFPRNARFLRFDGLYVSI